MWSSKELPFKIEMDFSSSIASISCGNTGTPLEPLSFHFGTSVIFITFHYFKYSISYKFYADDTKMYLHVKSVDDKFIKSLSECLNLYVKC